MIWHAVAVDRLAVGEGGVEVAVALAREPLLAWHGSSTGGKRRQGRREGVRGGCRGWLSASSFSSSFPAAFSFPFVVALSFAFAFVFPFSFPFSVTFAALPLLVLVTLTRLSRVTLALLAVPPPWF